MKKDNEYLKKLLEVFEKSKKLAIGLKDLKESGFDQDEKLVFHLRWLNDKGFVLREDLGPGFGYEPGMWSDVPLRYTAFGEEYLEALRKNSLEDEKNVLEAAKQLSPEIRDAVNRYLKDLKKKN